MAAGFNKNVALHNDQMVTLNQPLPTLKSGVGFTFIDFFPRKLDSGGFFKPATYDSFRTLVDRANEFLRSNGKWKVVSCESVKLEERKGIDSRKMTKTISGGFFTGYIRGLRLWLTERNDEKEALQQIGYFNLIPQKLEKVKIFREPKFETLDTVVERFNSMLHSNPLPGRIITIESLDVHIDNFETFDPDRSNWSEKGEKYNSYIVVTRIFYETDGCSEEKGKPC